MGGHNNRANFISRIKPTLYCAPSEIITSFHKMAEKLKESENLKHFLRVLNVRGVKTADDVLNFRGTVKIALYQWIEYANKRIDKETFFTKKKQDAVDELKEIIKQSEKDDEEPVIQHLEKVDQPVAQPVADQPKYDFDLNRIYDNYRKQKAENEKAREIRPPAKPQAFSSPQFARRVPACLINQSITEKSAEERLKQEIERAREEDKKTIEHLREQLEIEKKKAHEKDFEHEAMLAAEVQKAKRKVWCNICSKEARYRCCMLFFFCSTDCQLKGWKEGHQEVCRNRKQQKRHN